MSHQNLSQQDAPPSSPDPSGWPDGWYVYESGLIKGPMAARVVFHLGGTASDGKPRLVTRRGFSQWYPLTDLSELFRMTEILDRRVLEATARAETAPTQERSSPAPSGPSRSVTVPNTAPVPGTTIVQRKVIGTGIEAERISAKVRSPHQGTSMARPVTSPPHKIPPPPVSQSSPATAFGPRGMGESMVKKYETGSATAARTNEARATPKRRRPLTAKEQIMHEYFLVRGRMRLGRIRNPWMISFIGFPLTLGLYWSRWFSEVCKEICFHIQDEEKVKTPSPFLSLIPIVHFVAVYQLAKAVRTLETQNRYSNVSPRLAAMFAAMPPFAMAYLQDALNRHWILHVKHATMKQAQKRAP